MTSPDLLATNILILYRSWASFAFHVHSIQNYVCKNSHPATALPAFYLAGLQETIVIAPAHSILTFPHGEPGASGAMDW